MSDPSESVKKDEPKIDKGIFTQVVPISSTEPTGGGKPAIDDKSAADKRI